MKRLTALVLACVMALSIALTGCGSSIDANAVGATLNGREISLGMMNLFAKYQQANYDMYYLAYFGTGMWDTEVSEGVTFEESTKEGILESIQTLYLLEEHMADYGVTITAEEEAAITAAAQKFMADNSEKAIKHLGATEEYVAEMLRLYTIEYKVAEVIRAEVDQEVSDEDAAQRTFSYLRKYFTEETKESAKETMIDVAAAAKENFDEASKDTKATAGTYSYGEGEENMDEAVIAMADALKEGEVSALIEAKNYYYVIRLDSEFDKEATEDRKAEILTERENAHYAEVTEEYRKASEFVVNEDAWATVEFNRLFGTVTKETAE